MFQGQARIILPIPGLNVSRPWNVGIVGAGIDEAIPLAECALAVLRVVQRLEHPLVDARRHAFGLPGQVISVKID